MFLLPSACAGGYPPLSLGGGLAEALPPLRALLTPLLLPPLLPLPPPPHLDTPYPVRPVIAGLMISVGPDDVLKYSSVSYRMSEGDACDECTTYNLQLVLSFACPQEVFPWTDTCTHSLCRKSKIRTLPSCESSCNSDGERPVSWFLIAGSEACGPEACGRPGRGWDGGDRYAKNQNCKQNKAG